jgi:hypothetical protein
MRKNDKSGLVLGLGLAGVGALGSGLYYYNKKKKK